jgi:hypothetical protein
VNSTSLHPRGLQESAPHSGADCRVALSTRADVRRRPRGEGRNQSATPPTSHSRSDPTARQREAAPESAVPHLNAHICRTHLDLRPRDRPASPTGFPTGGTRLREFEESRHRLRAQRSKLRTLELHTPYAPKHVECARPLSDRNQTFRLASSVRATEQCGGRWSSGVDRTRHDRRLPRRTRVRPPQDMSSGWTRFMRHRGRPG